MGDQWTQDVLIAHENDSDELNRRILVDAWSGVGGTDLKEIIQEATRPDHFTDKCRTTATSTTLQS